MNFEHAKSLPGPAVQLLTLVTGMNSIQGAAEESFPEGVTEHPAWMLPSGCSPAEVQGWGCRAGSQLGLLGRCVDWGWACLGLTATLQSSFVLLLQSCWDCRWDAKALDALGGP